MVRRENDFKYETIFKGPYKIVQIWTNRTVTLQMKAVIDRLKNRHIKPYKILEVY